MKTNKYKIAVLTDLKKSAIETLKSTISLAKMIEADIEVFHVKKPTDIVKHESQLSAFRTINEQHTSTKKKLEDLISSVSGDKEINIKYSYMFGNVKNEIEDYLTQHKPDMIVLGKRSPKSLNLNGDSLTNFIIKIFKGAILITGNDNILESKQELSLGILNRKNVTVNSSLGQDVLSLSQKPIKAFSFVKQDNQSRISKKQPDSKTVDYVFEHNDNTIKNLSNYLTKTNINMLYLDRENNSNNVQGLKQSEIKSVINSLNISILLSSQQS